MRIPWSYPVLRPSNRSTTSIILGTVKVSGQNDPTQLTCAVERAATTKSDHLEIVRGEQQMAQIWKPEEINQQRRRFFGTAAVAVAAAQLGAIGSAAAQTGVEPPASDNQLAVAGSSASFAPIKQIDAGLLNVGYAEAGPASGPVVLLLHGWPYDIHSFVDVAPLLAAQGYRVIVPYLRGYGPTSFRSASTFRNGEQAAVALDIIALMDALKIKRAVLGGFDWGARTAAIIAALWPDRCKALVSVSGYLIGSRKAAQIPFPPAAEHAFWYQSYFATDYGRAGYAKYTHDFNKLTWQLSSPKWNFDDATFERCAASFVNPDHVDIVIHNYRWRLSIADGEKKYEDLERQLAEGPLIAVPTITMEGDANGALHGPPSSYAGKFTGKYNHKTLTGGVGHNLPQEAPQAFADAIFAVDRM
jgi:pimeloyl-ACP methyl ester carboxylesterase